MGKGLGMEGMGMEGMGMEGMGMEGMGVVRFAFPNQGGGGIVEA
jgi:hypothetical protein